VTTLLDVPTRVEGVQLIGVLVGSGYRTPPALVRRSDGQVLQLTPLLYLVLQACDGTQSLEQVAQVVGRAMGRGVSESDVRTLVDSHLRPLGLLRLADGSDPQLKRTDPLIGLKPRFAVTDPQRTRRLTDPFRVLFRPAVPLLVLAGFVAVVSWVFFDRGLGASAYDAFERPHLLLLVFVVSVISGGLHEFGHAAAARYSGAQPGAMGAGLYIVWPAFYTDVTDSYRLGRAGRIRTDLGGLYFNAIVVVLTYVWWWATGWEALLLLVATQVLQMAQQLLPLLRFDGYHLLADLAGVPDLYQRIRPTLLGLLPHRWRSPENKVLTPWARAVITLWVLVTVPLMALMLMALIASVPRLLGSAGAALGQDAAAVSSAWASGQVIDVAGHTLQLLGVALPVLATAVIVGRLALRWFGGLSAWSRGSGTKRLAAAALSVVMISGVAWAWWPQPGAYEPIRPDEEGTLANLFTAASTGPVGVAEASADTALATPARPIGAAARERLSGGGPLPVTFEEGTALPTEDDPLLTMVLVPNDTEDPEPTPVASPSPTTSTAPTASPTASPTGSPTGSVDPATPAPSPTAGTTPDDDTWAFPFDQPLAPEEGDNQALAVNTTDDSVTYDVAFALVWAQDDQVLNVNEAHAYASCTNCVTVAVAFQVVLIMDDAQVVVPQNLAVAANYECHSCITAAVANQLVLSIPGEPGEEQLLALAEVWGRIIELAQSIHQYTLAEINEQLDGFKDEITQILVAAPPVATTSLSPSPSPSTESPSSPTTPTSSVVPSPTDPATTSTPTSTPTPTPTPTSTLTPTPSPTESTTSPSPSPTPLPSTDPSPTGTTSPTPSPTPSPTDPTTTAEPTTATTSEPSAAP